MFTFRLGGRPLGDRKEVNRLPTKPFTSTTFATAPSLYDDTMATVAASPTALRDPEGEVEEKYLRRTRRFSTTPGFLSRPPRSITTLAHDEVGQVVQDKSYSC